MQQAGYKCSVLGFPWWSIGEDSTLQVERFWVRSLVGELWSHVARGQKKNEKDTLNLLATFSHRTVWYTHALSRTQVWGDLRRECDLPLPAGNSYKHVLPAQEGTIQPPPAQIREPAGRVPPGPCDPSTWRDIQMLWLLQQPCMVFPQQACEAPGQRWGPPPQFCPMSFLDL